MHLCPHDCIGSERDIPRHYMSMRYIHSPERRESPPPSNQNSFNCYCCFALGQCCHHVRTCVPRPFESKHVLVLKHAMPFCLSSSLRSRLDVHRPTSSLRGLQEAKRPFFNKNTVVKNAGFFLPREERAGQFGGEGIHRTLLQQRSTTPARSSPLSGFIATT